MKSLELVHERPSSCPKNTKAGLDWNRDQWLWLHSTGNKTCSRRYKLHWIIFLNWPRDWSASTQESGSGRCVGKQSGWLRAENYALELSQIVLSLLGTMQTATCLLFFFWDIRHGIIIHKTLQQRTAPPQRSPDCGQTLCILGSKCPLNGAAASKTICQTIYIPLWSP